MPAASTVFACTFFEKRAEEDDYERGCLFDTAVCACDRCHVTASSLPGLIEAIGNHFGLTLDDLFVPTDDEEITHFSYNRLEDGDGNEPSKHLMDLWRKGKRKLWLADLTFVLEKREVGAVRLEEFSQAGIKIHG